MICVSKTLRISVGVLNRHLTNKSLLNLNCIKLPATIQLRNESSNVPVSSESWFSSYFNSNSFGFITDAPVTRLFENLLIDLHDVGDLEWATTIFIAAFVFRLGVCFPMRIYQEKIMAKLCNSRDLIENILKKQNKSLSTDSIFAKAKANELMKKKVSPFLKESYFYV